MKLSDLNPSWITLAKWSDPKVYPFFVGVSFDCPHCLKTPLAVMFSNPISPKGLVSEEDWQKYMTANPRCYWTRTGDSFETLSLSPSINTEQHGHWHGHLLAGVVDGNVTTDLEEIFQITTQPHRRGK